MLISLLIEGLLTLTIPDKPKSPNQKYKTTKKGLRMIQKHENKRVQEFS